jgi:uncharacterized protein YbjT (DUF2867 family)
MSENIIVTGATGAVGRRAVADLVGAGHTVTGVARSARGRTLLWSLRASAVTADVYDVAELTRAFRGATVVVNLLSRIPPVGRMGEPARGRRTTACAGRRRARSPARPRPPAPAP